GVMTRISALSTGTAMRWRRSISSLSGPVLALASSHFPSGEGLTCSTMKSPGVSSNASPPVSGMEYKWGQLSWYETKAIRSLPTQCRLVPPWVVGTAPCGVRGAFQSGVAIPSSTLAVHIAQGLMTGLRRESGAPPQASLRMKAIRSPLGDHRGEPSLANAGAIHWIGVCALRNMPTNEWLPRDDTKASAVPS